MCDLICLTPDRASPMTQGCPQGLAQRMCGLVNTVWRRDSGALHGGLGTGAASPPPSLLQWELEGAGAPLSRSPPPRSATGLWARALCIHVPQPRLTTSLMIRIGRLGQSHWSPCVYACVGVWVCGRQSEEDKGRVQGEQVGRWPSAGLCEEPHDAAVPMESGLSTTSP